MARARAKPKAETLPPELPAPEEEPLSDSEGEGEEDPASAEADAFGAWVAARPPVPEPFEDCPLCAGLGVTPGTVARDPDTEPCPDCHGLGRVLTGSLNPASMEKACSACAGGGWRVRRPPPAEPARLGEQRRLVDGVLTGSPSPTVEPAGPLPYEPYAPAEPAAAAGL